MNDKDYYLSKNLYDKIIKASNEISKKSRNQSNYIITSPEVADAINGLQEKANAEEVRALREKKLKRILNKRKKK